MLTKTLQIAAICFSMANPSNFHIDQPKKADYTYINQVSLSTSQTTQSTSTWFTEYRNLKYSGQTVQNEFLIKEYVYCQTYVEIVNNNNTTVTWKQKQQDQNSILHVLQITPYQTTTNNQVNITLNISLNSFNDNYVDTYKVITEQYTSTEEYWRNFVDTANQGIYRNWETIQSITAAEQGFTYASQRYEQTITEGNVGDQPRQYTQNTSLYIDPNKTNFVYYYTYMQYIADDQSDGNTSTFTASVVFYPERNSLRITGQSIPPIASYEVIDLPGIMWEVLTMPFTFISVAFNLTLFPNTPYQVNLSNLFLSILGIIIFAFILSKFIKKV